jgi:hypothetical protein
MTVAATAVPADNTYPSNLPEPDSQIVAPTSNDGDPQVTALLNAPSGPVPVVNTEPVINGTSNLSATCSRRAGTSTIRSGGDFGLNLRFDNANLGDFFQWDSNGNLTSLGGDTYGLSSGSANGRAG